MFFDLYGVLTTPQNGRMFPERIAVHDLLPERGEPVIVYSPNTGVHRSVYADGTWIDLFGSVIERVTHWWPLRANQRLGEN